MSVRKFMDSLNNLKVPALRIYSFKSVTEQKNNRKPKSSLLKPNQEPNSLATTESSYNQPKTANSIKSNGKVGLLPELIPNHNRPMKSMVIKGYKGFEGKIKKTATHVSHSKIDIKSENCNKNNVTFKEKNEQKRNLGIDNLKIGIGQDEINGIEGFSQSTIRIEPEIDMEVWESQCELLDFIGYHPSYKK